MIQDLSFIKGIAEGRLEFKGGCGQWCAAFARILQCLGLLLLTGPVALGEPVSKEFQLKAAFLYNFAKFVEWPEQSFADARSPIAIGVFGSNAFAAELDKAVAGRKINGRSLVVRSVQSTSAARGMQLLFISATEDSHLGDLRESAGLGVLTVGESDAFAKHSGMIIFTPEGDTLAFEINITAAGQAGLKISAQLQKLARAVRKNP